MLHAGMAAALADGLVERIVPLGRTERRDIAHPEPADGLGDELKFRDRNEVKRAHVEQRALGLGVETADRFERVAEKIEPHGLLEPRRKQIEDATANRVFAGLAHRGGAAVAIMLEPRHDGIHRHDMAGRHRQRLRRDDVARRHPLHDGVDRGQHDQRLVAARQSRQPCQRGQPLRQDAAMWRHPVIGLAIPGRELHHRQIGGEEFQRPRQLLHARAITANHREADRRRLRSRRDRAREVRHHEPLGTLGHIGKGQRATGTEALCGRLGRRLHAP